MQKNKFIYRSPNLIKFSKNLLNYSKNIKKVIVSNQQSINNEKVKSNLDLFIQKLPELKNTPVQLDNSNIKQFAQKQASSFNLKKHQIVIAASYVFLNKTYFFKIPNKCFLNYNYKLIKDESDLLLTKFFISIIINCEKYLKNFNQTILNSDKKIVIYFHNFSSFDGILLYDFLLNNVFLNKTFDFNKHLKIININGDILELRFGCIYFLDSYKMVNMSLNNLSNLLLNESKLYFNVSNNTFDDLKIFCRDRKTAIKLLHALKDWLWTILKL